MNADVYHIMVPVAMNRNQRHNSDGAEREYDDNQGQDL
jgi:hypothetical protein